MYLSIRKCSYAGDNKWSARASFIGLPGARSASVKFPKILTLSGSQMRLIAIEEAAATYESTGVTRKQYRTPGEVTLTIVNE